MRTVDEEGDGMNVTVLHVKRLNSSALGNPAWELTVRTADGLKRYRTKANASTSYYIGQWVEGHDAYLELNRAGRIYGLTDLGRSYKVSK
jgi:hypothetical protein